MDRYVINTKDKNVRRAMREAHLITRRSGIPTSYFPAVKTKHIERQEKDNVAV